MIYIFDLDSTLCDLSHRLHFIQQDKPDWDAFFNAAGDDKPIFEVITVARALSTAGHTIVYSTGRSEIIRNITDRWLAKYRLPKGIMFMRSVGDHREDNVIKGELLDEIMHQYGAGLGGYGGVFEDRQQVVDMYRTRGLRVFQVAKGDF